MSRTYFVETYGCQMNAHDSERLTGLLEAEGMVPAQSSDVADVVVFNTCAVRENADNKLYGNLSYFAPLKKKNPNLQIAVGGCLAQKDKEVIVQKAPYVDVVFGTHNMGSLPVLLERARIEKAAQVEIKEALEHFPSDLPQKRHSAFSAWVSISVGCNNTCTFCIVPALRGELVNREPNDIIKEVEALVEQGVIEVTLLGQNVNAYRNGGFADLLRQVGKVDGLERIRFMSPHPRDFTDDVIEAMAETPNVMPHLHMPLQSGSDQILQAMRRSYRVDKYMGILDRVRTAIPHAAITTDIIVGFPGETEEDFQGTLDVVKNARFTAAYTYQYSIRPGTPAGEMENQIDPKIVGDRYDRLFEFQNKISAELNRATIGKTLKVLVSEEEGERDAVFKRLSGRAEDWRLVHFAADAKPGDIVDVEIDDCAHHYLIGTGKAVRKTRGSQAAEVRGTLLGMPKLRA